MVRAIVNAFDGRQRARKAVMQAMLAQGLAIEMMDPIMAFISAARTRRAAPAAADRALSPEQMFVLSRALMGAIRPAVLEEQPFLRSRAFEDEIVRLVVAYLSAITET